MVPFLRLAGSTSSQVPFERTGGEQIYAAGIFQQLLLLNIRRMHLNLDSIRTVVLVMWTYVSVGSVLNLHETSVSSIRALISRVSSEKTHVNGIEIAVPGVLLLAFSKYIWTIIYMDYSKNFD